MLKCFSLPRNSTRNELPRIVLQKATWQMSVLHQGMCIFKAGLLSLKDSSAKYKEKVFDVLDFTQNIKTTCNSRLKFTELKYLLMKSE